MDSASAISETPVKWAQLARPRRMRFPFPSDRVRPSCDRINVDRSSRVLRRAGVPSRFLKSGPVHTPKPRRCRTAVVLVKEGLPPFHLPFRIDLRSKISRKKSITRSALRWCHRGGLGVARGARAQMGRSHRAACAPSMWTGTATRLSAVCVVLTKGDVTPIAIQEP